MSRIHLFKSLTLTAFLSVSSPCYAQSVCSLWNALQLDSQNNFQHSGPGTGALGTCGVLSDGSGGDFYDCTLTFTDPQSAANTYLAMLNSFNSCFPNLGGFYHRDTLPSGHQVQEFISNEFQNNSFITFGFDVTPSPNGYYTASFDIIPP